MSISDSPRFINTPTLLEEYNEDQKGYDQVIDGDTVIELGNEYKAVSGNEEFYKVLLSSMTSPVREVAGNEGFMETMKKGATSVIQAVKDFFKWLFSFFTSKKEIAERKTMNLTLQIEKHGVKEEEVSYPASYTNVYPKTGVTANNLAWMMPALDDIETAMKRVEKYVAVVESTCNTLVADITKTGVSEEKLKGSIVDFIKKSQEALDVKELNKPTEFFGLNDFQMDGSGKIKELPDPPNTTKDPKFRTDQTQVLALLKKQQELVGSAYTMVETSTKLEKTFIKGLNSSLQGTKDKPQVKAAEDLQEIIRHVMANLKIMESCVFRAIFAASDILSATVKKG